MKLLLQALANYHSYGYSVGELEMMAYTLNFLRMSLPKGIHKKKSRQHWQQKKNNPDPNVNAAHRAAPLESNGAPLSIFPSLILYQGSGMLCKPRVK